MGGFHDATVRDICAWVEANVASVNYHFGQGRALHRSFEFCKNLTQNHRPPHPPLDASTRRPLARVASWYMAMLLTPHGWRGRGQLFAAMVDRTPALDHMVETVIRPRMHRLRGRGSAGIVGKETGRSEPLHRQHHGPVLALQTLSARGQPPFPDMKFDTPESVRLSDHISKFSLAALEAVRQIHSAK